MAVITKSYTSYAEANAVVSALKSSGYDDDAISLISHGSASDHFARDPEMPADRMIDPLTSSGTIAGRSVSGAVASRPGYDDDSSTLVEDRPQHTTAGDDAAIGATSGTILGGGAGLLAGLGLMAIPGLGPVVAAGWLAATATGALVGAVAGGATGGIIGALMDAGVPEHDSEVYAETVKRGGAIVSVRVADADRDRVERIMNDHGAIDPSATADEYRRTGWSGFDANSGAVPFNPNPPAI